MRDEKTVIFLHVQNPAGVTLTQIRLFQKASFAKMHEQEIKWEV